MKRRDFGKALVGTVFSAGMAGTAIPEIAAGQTKTTRVPRKNTKMHVGADYHVVAGDSITGRENLEYNLRFGVKHISPDPDLADRRQNRGGRPGDGAIQGGDFIPAEGPMGGAFNLEKLKRMRDDCDKVGMTIEGFRMDSGYIVMKAGPDREKKLDQICENIRKTSQVGVGLISQHWTMIPIRRNGTSPGRGGATYATFKLEEDWKALPVGIAGHVSQDEYWERITTFLHRVIPVCAEYKVKMATHPYDPPGLPFGYEGVENYDSPSIAAAIKRYEMIVESPWNGFQLDLGVLGEGLKDPNRQEPPIVEYLAFRGKIHQVHMRNIRGGLNNFAEVYPDEGDIDFFRLMRIFRDSGYTGGFLPDHMPSHPGDPGKLQAYAFGYGYIHALINAVNSEVA
jgi:mannonate dehydratase